MRSKNIVSLSLVLSTAVGCSFVDDFDKFERATGSGDDAEVSPADDAGSTAANDAAQPARDSGRGGNADIDSALPVSDAGGSIDTPDATSPEDGGTSTPADAGQSGVCGDGMVDRARGETCDDGNQLAGDGCEPVSCTETPSPTCAGVVCSDGDPCTVDVCDPTTKACAFRVIDGDRDGYAPGTCPPASMHKGGDCNDGNAAIRPGAAEICDGVDNNCDAARSIDEGLPRLRCYPDRDGDGFANLDGAGVMACSCAAGSLSVTSPADRTLHDCYDEPTQRGSDVFPGQTRFFSVPYGMGPPPTRSYDYDCDGDTTQQLKALGAESCTGLLGDLLLCQMNAGFLGDEAAACGVEAPYATCSAGLLNACNGTTEQRTQACR